MSGNLLFWTVLIFSQSLVPIGSVGRHGVLRDDVLPAQLGGMLEHLLSVAGQVFGINEWCLSEADKRRILEEAAQGSTGVAEVARRYGIDRGVLRRWKQELAAVTAPTFVTVQITDAGTPSYAGPAAEGAVS
jgi:transposase